MKKIRYVFVGILFLFLQGNLSAQNCQIQRILINYIEMDIDYPFAIDSILFDSMDYRSISIDDSVNLSLFQDCLNTLVQADRRYKRLDIRRIIWVIYYDYSKTKLYADNFHFLYKGTLYKYEGTLWNIVEKAINDEGCP